MPTNYQNIISFKTIFHMSARLHSEGRVRGESFLVERQGGASFVDHLCYICLYFVMISCASVFYALWSLAGKGQTFWL